MSKMFAIWTSLRVWAGGSGSSINLKPSTNIFDYFICHHQSLIIFRADFLYKVPVLTIYCERVTFALSGGEICLMNCNTWENITKRWIVKSGVRGCLSAIYCKIVVFAHIRGGIYLLNLPPVKQL